MIMPETGGPRNPATPRANVKIPEERKSKHTMIHSCLTKSHVQLLNTQQLHQQGGADCDQGAEEEPIETADYNEGPQLGAEGKDEDRKSN